MNRFKFSRKNTLYKCNRLQRKFGRCSADVLDRKIAVEYALNYALVPNIGSEDDFWFFMQDGTNFVSQCWYTGGIKQNGEIYYVQHSPNCLEHKLSEDNAKESRFICAKN